MSGNLLIRQARILTMAEPRHIDAGDILIRDGIVRAVGSVPPGDVPPGIPTIEAKGRLAIPGLINAHVHSPGNLMRGCLDGYPLEIFMLYEVPPLAEAAQAGRLAYLRTALGAIEMLKLGITSVLDDAFFVPGVSPDAIDAVMDAYRDSGMRATVALDQPNVVEYEKQPFLAELIPPEIRRRMDAAPRQSADELMECYAHLVGTWHGAADGRLSAAVSCSAPHRVTPDYFARLSELSRERDLPFFVHILETKTQRVFGEEKLGKSLARHVHDLGLLDERMLVIHAIWVDDADIALLARSGCTVAHNPVCNLRLGSGIMPFRRLRDAGVHLALGTDEATVDDTHNLWLAAKTAGLVHNIARDDYRDWPKAPEILDMLHAGGARAARAKVPLGRIAVGAAGDVALLDLATTAFTPLNDIERQLVYCETGSSVRDVIVAGTPVVANGRLLTLDESAILAEIADLAPKLAAEMAVLRRDAAELEPYYRALHMRAMRRDVGLSRRGGDG
jgi:cytosine/adenosine deaminase-related metal-dependent hydrolase